MYTFNIDPERTVCFTGNKNSKNKKADFTGAFLPETKNFMKKHGVDNSHHLMVDLDSNEKRKKESIFKHLEDITKKTGKAPETIVFACHGFKNRIELGLRITGLDDFANHLRKLYATEGKDLKTANLRVILYCCSTGSGPGMGGDNGFADVLRDTLCKAGFVNCRVVGHETAGHTVRNPYKRFFDGFGSSFGGTGGLWIVSPTNKALFRKWIKSLQTDFRFDFPFLQISEIHEYIDSNFK